MTDAPAPIRAELTNLREILRFVNRRKMILLAGTVLATALAWATASTMPPRFEATAVLALDAPKIQIVEHEVVSRLPQEASALRTELDVMRSRSVNEEVVDRLGLINDPDVLREAAGVASEAVPHLTRSQLTDWLLGHLKVSNDGRSLTIVVSFTSESPERAARIANAIAENYLDNQVQTKARATLKASDWLGQQLIKIREQLESSEAAVDDFRRKSGLLEVKGTTIPAERISDIGKQLAEARAERVRAEVKLQSAKESDPETLPDIIASPTVQQLRKEIAELNLRIAQIRLYSPSYSLAELVAKAASLQTQMREEMGRIIAGLSSEVMTARKREAELAQSFQVMESELGVAAHSAVHLIQLQREADANRSIYEAFLARYKQTIEQQSLVAPDGRLISRAEPPGSPNYPNKFRFLLLGVFGGLAVGGALAFLRDYFDRRIREVQKVEAVTGLPVFGSLPKVPRWCDLRPQDYLVEDPGSRFCAALERIHILLRAPKSSDRTQVILVTSAQAGDGKTSFCTCLARSLAKSRIRVLVMDADPYRSQVASSFGASILPAVAPIVDQLPRLSDVVQSDAKSAAHFVAGPREEDFQLLIHSGGFVTLLNEARQAYDIIIIDTPPVMTSADAVLIGRFADTRLLLVRWGQTCWDEMTAAVGFFRLCHVGLDGIVMVGVGTGSASYDQLARMMRYLWHKWFIRPAADPGGGAGAAAVFGEAIALFSGLAFLLRSAARWIGKIFVG